MRGIEPSNFASKTSEPGRFFFSRLDARSSRDAQEWCKEHKAVRCRAFTRYPRADSHKLINRTVEKSRRLLPVLYLGGSFSGAGDAAAGLDAVLAGDLKYSSSDQTVVLFFSAFIAELSFS